jgi:uncharacterized protein (TIGR03437 family)
MDRRPLLPNSVTIDGIPAMILGVGFTLTRDAGLMQVNVQIPLGVRSGRYVPIVLTVGDASTAPDAVWIAVSGN